MFGNPIGAKGGAPYSLSGIPKEIKEQVEKIELAPSLLEKLEIEKQNDSLLSRGEQ